MVNGGDIALCTHFLTCVAHPKKAHMAHYIDQAQQSIYILRFACESNPLVACHTAARHHMCVDICFKLSPLLLASCSTFDLPIGFAELDLTGRVSSFIRLCQKSGERGKATRVRTHP